MTVSESMNSITLTSEIVMKAIEKSTSFDPASLPDLIRNVHESLTGLTVVAGEAGSASLSTGPVDASSSETTTATHTAESLRGSTVYDDGSVLWPEISEERRKHFLALADQFHLKRDENGYPIPNTPDGRIATDEVVFDPFSGDRMKMIKSRLRKSYSLDRDDLLTMFRLPEDFKITAQKFSEAKRQQAERIGLGRSHRVPAEPSQAPVKPKAARGRPRREQKVEAVAASEKTEAVAKTKVGRKPKVADPIVEAANSKASGRKAGGKRGSAAKAGTKARQPEMA